ncbi:glycerophosphodiester phosphodiesterase 1 [Fibrella aestuarina BUZ 2]|uniref:Glycerophosphodiester phosphodiesterase 1 n=1 Tax=Fibrella aestuarina BUZ 2 TaxID=1166018 RepID=I0K9L8_9BACT|nr:glycerophosphodiester phosphodiesterase [Fibrella aestuarina]CCH00821.1 glycerophosphodiester phosphodiesterase 1 [Fibrella aestuarina BUZ 2]
MLMRSCLLNLASLWLLVMGCRPVYEAPIPYDFSNKPGSGPFRTGIRRSMEGVYAVSGGTDTFGEQVVLRWSAVNDGVDSVHTLSILTGVSVGFFNLEIDQTSDSLRLTGFWRTLTNQGTGQAALQLVRKRGGSLLPFNATPQAGDTLALRGTFDTGTGTPARSITLMYRRPLNPKPFEIIAHRGGGRTADLLGVSENSLAILRRAARFGATGVEIDVRYTKDSIPVLYHDNRLNQRLIQKNGLSGGISDYTFEQLQTSFPLLYGERIPTLEQALQTIVDNTDLQFVWIDAKFSGPMDRVQALQQRFNERARLRGRRLQIVIGLPSTDAVAAYRALPNKANTPVLCELDPALVRELGAAVWAPRWTLGPQTDEVRAMQAEGRRVFVWTLDDAPFIEKFVKQANLNGILSNYAPAVAYYHYTAP